MRCGGRWRTGTRRRWGCSGWPVSRRGPRTAASRTRSSTAAGKATPARATMLTLGLLLGGLEASLSRGTWRDPAAAHRAYFTALQSWGYPLSDVEQLVLRPAIDPSTDPGTEPDPPSDEAAALDRAGAARPGEHRLS